MIELRLRTKAHPDTVAAYAGKHVGDGDYDLLLHGPCKVLKPNGQPLAVYLPGQLVPVLEAHPHIYDILHSLRTITTDNRGLASGSKRVEVKGQSRTRARKVSSPTIGAADKMSMYRYCRLTAWTGEHLPEYQRLYPLLKAISSSFETHVPPRFEVQARYARDTHPDWVVPGTPFTTITVNNTYSTGVHTDKGDLPEGFSCLAVLRKGTYSGGHLVFPEYRTAVDMQHGDLLLMDAHDWHGNTKLRCAHGQPEAAARDCPTCQAERISVVAYYRKKMTQCGSAKQEHQRAAEFADKRSHLVLDDNATATVPDPSTH